MHRSYSRSHLTNAALRQTLLDRAARDCENTAELLADIAEFDERKLYREEGYDSIHAWCVGVLHLSDDSAYKRIQAARAASRFPAIFEAVASGQLHLSAVGVLAPHLDPETADELLEAAAYKTKGEIALLLASRSPKPDLPTRIEPIAPANATLELQGVTAAQLAPAQVAGERTSVVPRSPGRYLVQLMFDEEMH